jgi:hypothetical protein
MMMRRRLLFCAAALGTSGALCAAALAATSYSVKLGVPKSVKPRHSFTVKASGTAASTARLTVFLSKSCATSAKAEASGSAHEIVNKNVSHSFTTSKTAKAPGTTGSYHACAYLTGGGHTRAHASVTYFVVIGGY